MLLEFCDYPVEHRIRLRTPVSNPIELVPVVRTGARFERRLPAERAEAAAT